MAEAKAKKDVKVEDPAAGESVAVTVNKHALMTEAPATSDDSGEKKEATDSKPEAPATKEAVAPSTSRVKIQPLSKPEDLKPKEDDKPSEEKAETSGAGDDEDDSGDDSSAGRDKLKDASQEEQELIDKKAAERQANLNKIGLAKTYYLPINQVVRRRSKHVAIAGAAVAILLGLAWLDISMDAGLISVPGVKPPTHFFDK
jgi:hypothetical protein